MKFTKHRSATSLMKMLALLLAALPYTTIAQKSDDSNKPEQLSDLTVSADLREDTTTREVATSVSVLDQDTLSQAGTQHFQDVMGLVPNLNWSGSTSRPRYFQIRGIGERSQYEGAPNPSVGFIIDDIDFTGIGGAATLFDLQQVDVLRGPQGTRYGANALAGLIYVQSQDPSFDEGFTLETTVGDYGRYAAGFSATGSLGTSDRAAYRLAAHQFNSDGFRRNDFFHADDTDSLDEMMLRGKVNWTVNPDWQADLTLLLVDINNGFDKWNPENTLTTHSDDLGIDDQRSMGFSVRNTLAAANNFDFISITSYTDSDIQYFFDGDWGNDEYWGEFAPYDFTSNNDRERKNFTQEFRLVSKPDARVFNSSTDWLTGLYLAQLDEDNVINDFYNGDVSRAFDSRFSAMNIALFGQFDTHINETTVLTTGLRFERRTADYNDNSGLDLSPDDDMFGGQISINHEWQPGKNIYATLSRGYKAGGFNLSATLTEDRRAYDPEFLLNLEVGIKALLLDYRLSLNLSAFYAKRQDMQVSTSTQDDPTDPLTYTFFTGNAATGKNYGLEADWLYQINRNLSFHGSLGLLNATFDDYVTVDDNFNGRKQAHAPDYTFNLGMNYSADSGWFARADLNGSDGFYFSDSHQQRAEAREILHLKVGYQSDSWSVYAWGRNVLDETYAVRGFYFGVEPPDYADTLYKHLGDPKHFGLTAQFQF
ncbi:TonB-dependent receptor [Marinicella litoralis]|uniref:Outer membrane receptor protein involved in Fe transport n=1 Tax=Marinicella litoralis TaxID=644220 RepID=A0A4R6XW02_9GAMM|nr:TonB-dependent receptor [Marinicella litoralis]TDR20658.1 outer membrane receptor protein involved in Fe transport [Marinicella litoralis]